MESLELPANLGWTNAMGNGQSTVAGNWRDLDTGTTATAPPAVGDNLTFDGSISNAWVYSLTGFGLAETVADFASIQLVNNYSGTVNIAPDGSSGLSVGSFTLDSGASGAIAQQYFNTNLTVLSNFSWTRGILNSTPSSTATVTVAGSGTITLPTGGTLTCGSMLNFTNPAAAAVETVISGGGTLLLNGLSPDGIFVRADAKVRKVVQGGTPGAIKGFNSETKTLTLDAKAEWG